MRESIKESIEELKCEVANLPSEERESRDKLIELVQELETELDNRELDSFDDFIEPLSDSISTFETSHPKLTQLINNVSITFSWIIILDYWCL